MNAVCLSVDWVPKLIRNFFPAMEQKLVQRCETEVVSDACNASYVVNKWEMRVCLWWWCELYHL